MNPLGPAANAAARVAADDLARRLAVPPPTPPQQRGRALSLADGAAGIALVHVERAHAGLGGWDTAHAWLEAAAQAEVSAVAGGLHLGAPALAFTLHAADADGAGRYTRTRATLDRCVAALTHRRVEQAHARIDRGDLPGLAEFDLISGLSGIGAHLLRHAPGGSAMERVLSYLVRLTEPLRIDGETLPGWWTGHDPHFTTPPGYGGHGNLGLAHGISGPLTLLALARRRGIAVDGHLDAVERTCAWLDTWRRDHEAGPWWPQWITHEERRTGRVSQPGPLRPSWCYGVVGLSRAQQLAGIVTGETARRRTAEDALAGCLADPEQLGRVIDTSLCHGWAGLFQTAWRAAADAATPVIAARLPHLTDALLQHTRPGAGAGIGLLEGDAGLALALHTAAHGDALSGWDACLMIT